MSTRRTIESRDGILFRSDAAMAVYGASDDLVELKNTGNVEQVADQLGSAQRRTEATEFPVYCPDGKGYFVLAGKN